MWENSLSEGTIKRKIVELMVINKNCIAILVKNAVDLDPRSIRRISEFHVSKSTSGYSQSTI